MARSGAASEEGAIADADSSQEVNRAEALQDKEHFMEDIVHYTRKGRQNHPRFRLSLIESISNDAWIGREVAVRDLSIGAGTYCVNVAQEPE